MPPETEAAYLLRTGQLYLRRVGLRVDDDDLIFAGVKHGAMSLYLGEDPHVHVDLNGRWQRAFRDGTHYRRFLDGRVMAMDRAREGASLVLSRTWLEPADVRELDDWVQALATELRQCVERGDLDLVSPPPGARRLEAAELCERLSLIERWDVKAWQDQSRLFQDVYGGPLPFLPPGMPPALLLQATLGEAGGRGFRGKPVEALRVRSRSCFEDHVKAVKGLLGRRLSQCRTTYLAGPDVARQPLEVVLGWLEVTRSLLAWPSPGQTRRRSELGEEASILAGFQLFLDDFSAPMLDASAWLQLGQAGLDYLHLGIVSGSEQLRQARGATWTEPELASAVADMKSAGLRLSLNLLVPGGQEDDGLLASHAAETARVVAQLPVTRGDLVTLVDEAATEASSADLAAQRQQMRAALLPVLQAKGMKLAEPHDWIDMI